MSTTAIWSNPKLRECLRFAWRLLLAGALPSLISWLAARAQPNQGYVPIRPSGGLGLALVWHHGAKYWPAVFAGNTALSTSVGTPSLIASGFGWMQVLIVMARGHAIHRPAPLARVIGAAARRIEPSVVA